MPNSPGTISKKRRRNKMIKELADDGWLISSLARDFQVSERQVYRIIAGEIDGRTKYPRLLTNAENEFKLAV